MRMRMVIKAIALRTFQRFRMLSSITVNAPEASLPNHVEEHDIVDDQSTQATLNEAFASLSGNMPSAVSTNETCSGNPVESLESIPPAPGSLGNPQHPSDKPPQWVPLINDESEESDTTMRHQSTPETFNSGSGSLPTPTPLGEDTQQQYPPTLLMEFFDYDSLNLLI